MGRDLRVLTTYELMTQSEARPASRGRILYLSYDGILEPLGESQVLSYLERLAGNYDITLVSFEKRRDTRDGPRFAALQERLARAGIEWRALSYHKHPPVVSTAYDALCAWWHAWRWRGRYTTGLAHARGYVPGLVALLVRRTDRIRFLFDMRGFWPEEKVEAGHWTKHGLPYRVAKWCERRFFENADAIVSLTGAGVRQLCTLGYNVAPDVPIEVIPTCVDLDRFSPGERDRRLVSSLGLTGHTVVGCVGTISGWYLRADMLAYLAVLARRLTRVKVLIVTRDDHHRLRTDARHAGLESERLVLVRAEFDEMPTLVRLMDVGVFFIRPTFSKKGSAATKLGEFLACGVPVVINAGVGDSDVIVKRGRVGVVLPDTSLDAFEASIDAVRHTLSDPDTKRRCRYTATETFDLNRGVSAYEGLYRRLIGPHVLSDVQPDSTSLD